MRSHPIGHVLKLFIDNVDNNPKIQLRIHTWGFYYWTVNFPLICYMFFCMPSAWNKYGIFITLMYSIYANFSTDYAGMSSAQAVINTGGEAVSVKAEPLGSGVEIVKKVQ